MFYDSQVLIFTYRKTAKFSSHRSELSKVVLGSCPSDACLIDARTERVLSMSGE